jgi:hypothetical protein
MTLALNHAVSATMARSTGAIKDIADMSFVLASLLSVLSRLLAAILRTVVEVNCFARGEPLSL